MLFGWEISKDEPVLSRLGGTVFLLAHRHSHSCSSLLSLNVKKAEKKKSESQTKTSEVCKEGRRPCIKTVSAQHGAQSFQGSQPTDCTFIRSLEGGVAATAPSSQAFASCCPPCLQERELPSLPEESLFSPSLEKCHRCAVWQGGLRAEPFCKEPAYAGGKGQLFEAFVSPWWSRRSHFFLIMKSPVLLIMQK